MTQTSLGRKLRILRGERGLSMRGAAELCGVTKETLSALERDTREPHDPTLAKIAKGYGVPFEELLEEPALAGKAEAPEAGRSEARPNVETPQELSLLDDPQIVDWLLEHGLTWGTMTSAEFEKHVQGLNLEEADEDGRPLAVMELGRALGYQRDKARDLLWTQSKYRSLGGLLSVDPNAPVAEQKNQRRDQLSKLRMELDRRYRRRMYALKRYAEFLTELLAAQKKSTIVSSIVEMRRVADALEEGWNEARDQACKEVA